MKSSVRNPIIPKPSDTFKIEVPGADILIMGVGNYLMGDEGVGVHCIHELNRLQKEIKGADLLDGGVGGFTLMSYFDEYEHIIFLDATMDGKPPGTITLTEPKFAADFPSALSAHDFGLKDMIESLFLLGKTPHLYLITISIDKIKPMHIGLSEKVEQAIPMAIEQLEDLVGELVKKHGLTR
jgi:hydrogenase maturation protease